MQFNIIDQNLLDLHDETGLGTAHSDVVRKNIPLKVLMRKAALKSTMQPKYYCRQFVDACRAHNLKVYFSGSPEACDLCGTKIENEQYFDDAEVPEYAGKWGDLCATCITQLQIRPEWGVGQLYQHVYEDNKEWLLVAGFAPSQIP